MRPALLAICVCVAVACSDSAVKPEEHAPLVSDSAGIRIVSNNHAPDIDSLRWTIDSLASLEIGKSEGAAPYLFGRVAGAARFSDGRIAIGDAYDAQIRIFDTAGVFLEQYGRTGQGPGEYINFSRVARQRGDSLFVLDYEGLRGHVLAPDGRPVRSFFTRLSINPQESYSRLDVIGFFSDGAVLVSASHRECNDRKPLEKTGYCENSATLFQMRADGTPGMKYGKFVNGVTLSGFTAAGHSVGFGNITPRFLVRAFGDRFYYVDGSKPEIRVFDRDKGLVSIIRIPDTRAPTKPRLPPMPASVASLIDFETHVPYQLSWPERQRVYNALRFPEFARYFTAMQIDLDGNIWLEDSGAEPVGDEPRGSNRWWVFDSTGVLITRVIAPENVRPGSGVFSLAGPEIGSDYILVQGANADGAGVVRLHRIHKR